jgi:hypothetical protein
VGPVIYLAFFNLILAKSYLRAASRLTMVCSNLLLARTQMQRMSFGLSTATHLPSAMFTALPDRIRDLLRLACQAAMDGRPLPLAAVTSQISPILLASSGVISSSFVSEIWSRSWPPPCLSGSAAGLVPLWAPLAKVASGALSF